MGYDWHSPPSGLKLLYIVSMTKIISRVDLHCPPVSLTHEINRSFSADLYLCWTEIIRVQFPLSNCLLIIFVHAMQQEMVIQLLFQFIGA